MFPLSRILHELRLGELMTEPDLTGQATLIYVVFIFVIAMGGLWLAAKAFKAWRDAIK